MGIGDSMIEKAVEEAFEKSDIEPGELNHKIDKVMEVIEQVSDQFDDVQEFQGEMGVKIDNMQDAATTLAEASVAIAEAAESMNQAMEQSTKGVEDLDESVEELNETFETIEDLIPEEE